MLFFTHYLTPSTDSLEGPHCPHHDCRATGSPMDSRPLWTRARRGYALPMAPRPPTLRMLTPPSLTSKFVGMAGYAPASFHDLVDDEVESDGSSIGDVMAPSHPLSYKYAMADALGQRPVVAESL